MKNPFTLKIESWLGLAFVILFSAFLIGLFLIALKNFNSDTEIIDSMGAKLRVVSSEERLLIDRWLQKNNIGVSAAEVGYRYIIQKFPGRPWIER
jgi:hypothetical protein